MSSFPGSIGMYVDPSIVFTDALVDPRSHYAIVIHKTGNTGNAPTAQEQARDFQSSSNINGAKKSVHYIVGKDGTVAQCVDERDGAGGNCCLENGYDPFWDKAPIKTNLNLCTFSIEHCSGTPDGDNSDEVTPQQAESSFKLIAYLCHKYSIGIDHIKGHNTLDPIDRKNCPGNYPWNDLFKYLEKEGVMIPAGWNDDGNVLVAPNGNKVILGFRDYVLNNSWDSKDVPLENEQYPSPVLESDISLGAGSRQTFIYNQLIYTQGEGVTLSPIGQEYMHVRADRDNCRTIISELQGQIEALKKGIPSNDIQTLKDSLAKVAADLNAMVK